jgi:hypothetical protein
VVIIISSCTVSPLTLFSEPACVKGIGGSFFWTVFAVTGIETHLSPPSPATVGQLTRLDGIERVLQIPYNGRNKK